MQLPDERWIPPMVWHLPRVASRVTDEWTLHNRPAEGGLLPLKGYPALSVPEHIVWAAQAAAAHPASPPARGLLSLREGICRHLARECGTVIDPEREVLVTNGAMQALHIVFLTILAPGDEVIVPSPCFFLEGLVQRLGARLVFVPMDERRDFAWDLDRIAGAITERTKILFVNTPVNPTGRVLTLEELQQIGRISQAKDICILSDESYDRLVYDGRRHISPLALPDLRARTILVRSFTKSYVMPSWRVGYIVAPSGLIDTFLKVFEWTSLFGNHVCQAAATAAISGPQDWWVESAAMLQRNRDRLLAGIHDLDQLSCVRPQGGPFLFPNVSRLGLSGDAFADLLLRQLGVPSLSGSAMQGPEHVRIPFGAADSVIDELVGRLHTAVRSSQPLVCTGRQT